MPIELIWGFCSTWPHSKIQLTEHPPSWTLMDTIIEERVWNFSCLISVIKIICSEVTYHLNSKLYGQNKKEVLQLHLTMEPGNIICLCLYKKPVSWQPGWSNDWLPMRCTEHLDPFPTAHRLQSQQGRRVGLQAAMGYCSGFHVLGL